jgi:protein TonB
MPPLHPADEPSDLASRLDRPAPAVRGRGARSAAAAGAGADRPRWRPLSGSLVLHGALIAVLASVGIGLAGAPATPPPTRYSVALEHLTAELREAEPYADAPFPELERPAEVVPETSSPPFRVFVGPVDEPEAASGDALLGALRNETRLPGRAASRTRGIAPAAAGDGASRATGSVGPTPGGPVSAAAPTGRTSDARATNRPAPSYPTLARRRGWEGTVIVLVRLDAAGRVIDTSLARTSGRSTLDDVAVSAVADWDFEPAFEQGRAIPSELAVPVTFRLTRR